MKNGNIPSKNCPLGRFLTAVVTASHMTVSAPWSGDRNLSPIREWKEGIDCWTAGRGGGGGVRRRREVEVGGGGG